MDGYAIELGFAPKASAKIAKIGLNVAAAGLHYEYVDDGNKPHLTLAAFESTVDADRLAAVTAEFARTLAPFDITFTSIAQFATAQNVIYLAPLITADLFAIYQAFQDVLAAAQLEPGYYHRPGSWVPHTTITMKGPKADLGPTMEIVRKAPVFNRPMRLDHINLVWYPPFKFIDRFELQGGQKKI